MTEKGSGMAPPKEAGTIAGSSSSSIGRERRASRSGDCAN